MNSTGGRVFGHRIVERFGLLPKPRARCVASSSDGDGVPRIEGLQLAGGGVPATDR